MTTINATYILIAKPYVAAGMRARAIAQGRDITNAQSTAEQTAAIIEREVGRLLQLALAAAQIPGVTPASGSVYAINDAVTALDVPTAAENASATLAAAQADPIHANVKETNDIEIVGDGTTDDKFRSALYVGT